jgi:hypothetical protein
VSAPFTKGPWVVEHGVEDSEGEIYVCHSATVCDVTAVCTIRDENEANARLIAAAPELYGGCNALLGLIQLLLGRDDLTDELRQVLTTNHRIGEANAAVEKAAQS